MLSRSNAFRNRLVATSTRLISSSSQRNNTMSRLRYFSSAAAAQEEEESAIVVEEVEDSFEILGLPRKFNVSASELKQSYRTLMTKYHPDKHSSGGVVQSKEDVEDMASKVTNAYQVLKEPHTRATHLLDLVGSPVDETSQTNLVGMEFLMEVMEIREDVDSTDPKYLKPIWEETQGRSALVVEELTDVFEQEDYPKAMELASQLQYWRRIQTAIHEKMDLDDSDNDSA